MVTGGWETCHIRQRWGTSNGGQSKNNSQGGSIVHLVELESNDLLWCAFIWLDIELKSLLSTIKVFEVGYWTELANRSDVVFHQYTAKPHISIVAR